MLIIISIKFHSKLIKIIQIISLKKVFEKEIILNIKFE
jgi:hypothetical protein